jgi:hypothetical protein
MKKFALIIGIYLANLLTLETFAQSPVFSPISCDSCATEILKVKRFQELKFQLTSLLTETNYESANKILDTINVEFNQSYLSQVYSEVVQLGLALNDSLLWQNTIDNFIKSTLWDVNTVKSLIDNEEVHRLDSGNITGIYIENRFDELFATYISKHPEKKLIDQLFWIKAIWQRDQDYRRYYTQNKLYDSSLDSVLWYFDNLNLESLNSFITNHGYPKFAMGTYCFSLVLLHINQPDILNEQDFNQLNISMWNSVIAGDTKLSDYCYVIDRYLVNNLKTEPIYGLFYPDDISPETINKCYLNRNDLGLRL